ncbi:hypothetical protein PR003_g8287 [Phytophthora rubi]|uniref:Uncharacterized protein n=1 Tax=Phytophthora rubi TaxID=129364 RepID=A0A6A4FBJ5_9STRA|nr:hypothetical protein PR002_g8639 [Phytophthora rubi]KAE9344767.1 hypothetical protein PR003_g8287 [Phytophthora rubi]
MEDWKQLRNEGLLLLVLWIDVTLEKYRGADLHHGKATRSEAALKFAIANPSSTACSSAFFGTAPRKEATDLQLTNAAQSIHATVGMDDSIAAQRRRNVGSLPML